MRPFGARLAAAVDAHGPLCAGVDPHPALLAAWGLPDTAAGLERFALGATEALAPVVAALKPQSAFFERFGSAGVAVLERVLATAREAGVLTVVDVKRGDIGSTAQGYAEAYLDPASPLAADALTVSPYLGTGSLQPFFDTARAHGAGVFVLALTSNPEAPPFQQAVTAAGPTVAGSVLDHLRALNASEAGPLGSFGAVVGATIGRTEEDLDVGGPLLVPGLGAQGGTVADVRRIFGPASRLVLASSSREILRAGPDPAALAAAARAVAEDLAALREAP
ncbi:Orotidine 5'-phosphate decarboxylase [Marmoricola sp. Leaf446]|uniref:orotidine-5'-phosphate decarboxylase n=1 Tax=Marmoricola sp. Leaf446 TaxID=1736379 RepID=UPI0006FA083C|nr:orotidine-5'-phosphate decarboxylase [Marmoricola sp. Leaf446]KQT89121.1 Orotidine 5'-phosphate decarboxylase [Marmoricola sp. Leaf446]